MKHLIRLYFVALFMGMGIYLNAQDYKTALGLRGGWASGVTVKHFISEKNALEGILSSRWNGFMITGLYEVHKSTEVSRLNWYYGGGAHIGFWDGSYVTWGGNGAYTVIGVDGILGIEYNISEIPINISLDWKPALNLVGYTGFWGSDGAFSVRYTF